MLEEIYIKATEKSRTEKQTVYGKSGGEFYVTLKQLEEILKELED